MSQIIQVKTGRAQVQTPDGVLHDSLEKVLITDAQFDKLASGSFTNDLTDLGPGLLAKVVALSGVIDDDQLVAEFTPGFAGKIRSLCALVTTAVTTGSKAAGLGVWIDNSQGTSEAQTLTATGTPTSGTFTLTFDGETTSAIAYDATAGTIQTALLALDNLVVGDVVCTGGPIDTTPVVVTFGGLFAGTDVPVIVANGAALINGTEPTMTPSTTQIGGGGNDEVQRITPAGTPTGGTYTITYSGQTTAAIDWDATAAEVQAALIALSNLAPADVVVTGGPSNSAFLVLTFGGTLADTNVAQVTCTTTSLTNATEAGVAVTTGTPGVEGDTEPVQVAGATLALTSANCTPIGAVVIATNVTESGTNPAIFSADSRISIRTTAAPTDFSEGSVALILVVEPLTRV